MEYFTPNGLITQCRPCDNVYYSSCESTGPCCDPNPCRTHKKNPQWNTRDAVRMKDGEVSRWFSFSAYCGGSPITPINHCMRMEVSRLSRCDGPWTSLPLEADIKGNVHFSWPPAFLAAPPGYYEAVMFFEDRPVAHVLMYKPFAKVNVHGGAVTSRAPERCACKGSCTCGITPAIRQPGKVAETVDCGDCGDAGCS